MVISAIKTLVEKVLWKDLDFLIIDMPPGTGDTQLTFAQDFKIDGAIIISTPQDLALLDVKKGIQMFDKTNIDIIGLVDNMSFFKGDDGKNYNIFGEGGVDDAEDADVIIHEYTHAIMRDATGQDPSGTQRSTLDEANADILAASYSRSISEHNWDKVYTWDGHNEYWDGRLTSGNKHYPEDLKNNLYLDTDIWSAAIMELWGKLGRNTTDKLLIESSHAYSTGMTLQDAAMLFMITDSSFTGSDNTWDICNTFLTRGLLDQCFVGIDEQNLSQLDFTLWNSKEFSNNTGKAFLYSKDTADITIAIYDIKGSLIFNANYPNVDRVAVNPEDYPTGIYTISITQKQKQGVFKLIKH